MFPVTSPEKPDFLGFPPPFLGEAPVRLPVLGRGDGWIALEKPAGIGLRAHPWDPAVKDIDRALNQQLRAGKGELTRTGATRFASAYYLDPEIAGVGLFATTSESQDRLRNAVGSQQAEFRFLLALPEAADGVADPEMVCEAPLLPHRTKPMMVPSTAKGKKTRTRFRRLARVSSGWALWEASTGLLRPHQIRVHASLCGLPIPGDALYGGPPVPSVGEVRRGFRGPGASEALFSRLPVHLASLSVPLLGIAVSAPASRAFRAALRQLSLWEAFEAACGA